MAACLLLGLLAGPLPGIDPARAQTASQITPPSFAPPQQRPGGPTLWERPDPAISGAEAGERTRTRRGTRVRRR